MVARHAWMVKSGSALPRPRCDRSPSPEGDRLHPTREWVGFRGVLYNATMSISELDTEAVRRRRTTPGMVADVLRDAIMRGVLKGGQPLRQDELAAQFGLSRIPVREALRQLEGEGLVTVNPHRGAVVSTLSSDELQEVCEIRSALETMALRLAIPHLDEEALARAEAILVETDRETDVLEH